LRGNERLATAIGLPKVKFKFLSKTVESVANKIADQLIVLVFLSIILVFIVWLALFRLRRRN